ncbi:CD225/dispanin family protein [Gordonia humi]|uniref:Interferon-induced transmembrane protein n=1 Tax=Gordonia humi TaxID=686429 RepID=A0A840ETR0_9ACTN|nr:CD225/dispanin family protein [Gordonia humi]MBB4134961.1 hypothetical protein [Gordonia humi]
MTNPPGNNGDSADQPDPFAETQFGQPRPDAPQPPQGGDNPAPTPNPFGENPFAKDAPQFGEQPPQYGQPQSGSDYGQPQGQPDYGQPQGGAPQYGQQPPTYGQPQPDQPQYGQQPFGAVPQYPANPYAGAAAGPAPSNSMASAIIVTVLGFIGAWFTCLTLVAGIIGIVAIVKANGVNGLWTAGDAAGSQRAAADAKKWSNIAWIAFGVAIALWIILIVILFAVGGSAGYYHFD